MLSYAKDERFVKAAPVLAYNSTSDDSSNPPSSLLQPAATIHLCEGEALPLSSQPLQLI
jgi:hypothetical protein